MYLKQLKNDWKKSDKYIYISSDFETLIHNNIHYVYAVGLMYNIKVKITKLFFINTLKDIIHIEEESLLLLKKYIEYLLFKLPKKKTCVVYFHNLRSFDGIFIIKCINKYFYTLKKNIIIKNNLIYKIVLRNIIFLDTLNILNNSLNYISNLFLKKKKNTFSITKIKNIKDINKHYDKIYTYLYKDVQLLYEIVLILVERFFTMYNIDIVKNFTMSSISMAIFRKHYLKNNYLIEITKNYKYTFIKESYFGGLNNILNTYMKGIGYSYDINSLYPYSMSTCEMPLGRGQFIYKFNNMNIEKFFGFISCYVYVPTNLTIPPLVTRSTNGIVCQAHGYLKGTWFTEEVKYAISLGCVIKEIYTVLNYEKKEVIFKEFVISIYKKKKEALNNIDKKLFKTLLNSLYGRFGMKLNSEITEWDIDEERMDMLEHITNSLTIPKEDSSLYTYRLNEELYKSLRYIKIENKVNIDSLYKNLKTKEKNVLSSVQIASAIASYSRVKLLKDMYYHMKTNKATIYYYDTDSIFTNKPLDSSYVSKNEIGKYKLVNTFNEGVFLSPKNYCIKTNKSEIIKFKGLVKKIKDKKLTFYKMKKLLKVNSFLSFKDVYIPIKSSLKNLTIKDLHSSYTYTFMSDKYIKVYDKENLFIKTRPKYIEKEEKNSKIYINKRYSKYKEQLIKDIINDDK